MKNKWKPFLVGVCIATASPNMRGVRISQQASPVVVSARKPFPGIPASVMTVRRQRLTNGRHIFVKVKFL